jgi:dimethylamine monooxygenase subunit A
MLLEEPAHYYPFDKGVYQVAPLLRPFSTSFGNSAEIKERVFQIDRNFEVYRAEKIRSITGHFGRHVLESRLNASQRKQAARFIFERLRKEYPSLIQSTQNNNSIVFRHTGDSLVLDHDATPLSGVSSDAQIQALGPSAEDPLLVLALQIQEDFSLWTYDEADDWMAYASICFPNHWAPEDKIGKNFFEVHQPVAGAASMLQSSSQLVQGMVHRGPFVRFAWGMATDTALNHHPLEPQGRRFDPAAPKLWVRAERQTLHGFPDERLAFFTIRTYFEDVKALKTQPQLRQTLRSALLSISPASLVYKGLDGSLDAILDWI